MRSLVLQKFDYEKYNIYKSCTEEIDNKFSKWLTLQLIGAGYEVWGDLLKLKGGEDFLEKIEDTIRNKCINFLYVLSQNSNER